MTFKQRLNNALSAMLPNNTIFAEYYRRSTAANRAEWKRQSDTLQAKEIRDWKMGVMAATDPDDPRRGNLMRFYQSLMLDNHLASVIDTRILRVQRSSFKLLDDNDNENYELKALLERPWFEDLIRFVLLSRFQGTTLIEMFDIDQQTQELTGVEEIPQSNFIAQKGIIIKEEFDTKGVDYRTGALSNYYFQVGNDWSLGMFNQLAMIVLAKKLGLGSWMSYVDKYGVPAIFAITDRMDTGRRDELFEMMSAFRQNMFGILQGSEKIEVLKTSDSNAHQVFLSLIDDVCNKEISKRVLGGTATTDEKSFVGSAEVQERVAQDRYEADKLLFKYVFNTQIRWRLAKISSVYADFSKYTLEWNNQETFSTSEYINFIVKLAPFYNFDIDEIAQRTGLPIISIKNALQEYAENNSIPKSLIRAERLGDLSSDEIIDAIRDIDKLKEALLKKKNNIVPTAATWDTAIEQLVNQIWEGNANAADLNQDLVLKYYSGLNKAAKNGWGSGYYTNELTRNFRENLLKFSGAKSYNLIKTLQLAAGNDGSKESFLTNAKKLISQHNETWQQVEETFAANSASSAHDFQSYQNNIDLYPNLIYRTMEDDDVRPEHAENEGVIKPVNEWTVIPPLDFRCRCWLEQTQEDPNGRDIVDFNKNIANNAALTGKLFSEKASYFERISANDRQVVTANTELMKDYMPYNRTIEVGENSVFINDFAHLDDLQPNIDAAKIVADFLSKDVYIRPHIIIPPNINVPTRKNPEFGIGNKNTLGDLKTMESADSKNFFASRMRSANEQKCKYVVMNIDKYNGSIDELKEKIKSGLVYNGKQRNRNIEKIIIIRNNNVVQLTRKQVNKNLFGDLEKLL